MFRVLLLGALLGVAASAQTCSSDSVEPVYQNIRFTAGQSGQPPPGWCGGSAQLADGAMCRDGGRCAVVSNGFMFQRIDARAYRGKTVVFHAAVRVHAGFEARLILRIHHNNGEASYVDNLGKYPLRSDRWTVREAVALVALDARDLEFGLAVRGPGEVFIDDIALRLATKVELDARATVRAFAEARNRHDAEGMAAVLGDGAELADRMETAKAYASIPGQVDRFITSAETTPASEVIVNGEAWFEGSYYTNEVFVVGFERAGKGQMTMKIQVHRQWHFGQPDEPYRLVREGIIR